MENGVAVSRKHTLTLRPGGSTPTTHPRDRHGNVTAAPNWNQLKHHPRPCTSTQRHITEPKGRNPGHSSEAVQTFSAGGSGKEPDPGVHTCEFTQTESKIRQNRATEDGSAAPVARGLTGELPTGRGGHMGTLWGPREGSVFCSRWWLCRCVHL